MIRQALVGVVILALAAPALAETKSYELTVTAGEHDRASAPVSVLLPVPAGLAKAQTVLLQDSAGKSIPAQLTAAEVLAKLPAGSDPAAFRELHFVLPGLKAKETAVLKATVSSDSSKAEGFSWHDTPPVSPPSKGGDAGGVMELRRGNQPVLRYMYTTFDDSSKDKRELTYKVYHHLFDLEGRLLTKGPGGMYPHHRGLYFGFNNITYGEGKKADIWHCTGDAYQSHEKFLASEAGPVLGRHRLEIAWHGQKKEVFAVEERELTAYTVPGGQLVEFATRLRSTGGKIKLDGDPQHAGFQFRAAQEVAASTAKQTYYLRPDGPGKPGETKQDGDYPWKAMSFVVGGQRYTACYLDRPANPKPAKYSERDYGRFGSYFVYEVTPEKPLEIKYRLWVQNGELKVPEVAARAADFTQPVQVTVK